MTDHGNLMLARVRACAAGQPAPDERLQAMPPFITTPGPWTAQGPDIMAGKPPFERGHPGWRIVGAAHGGEQCANARLMAAAPDMLEALNDCAGVLQSIENQLKGKSFAVTAVLKKARAAIAKAEG